MLWCSWSGEKETKHCSEVVAGGESVILDNQLLCRPPPGPVQFSAGDMYTFTLNLAFDLEELLILQGSQTCWLLAQ